jgi:hypothetical protein
MQFLISVVVAAATLIQMGCAVIDLREANRAAARWMGAEDDLVAEAPAPRRAPGAAQLA